MVSTLILFGVPVASKDFDRHFDGTYLPVVRSVPHVQEVSIRRVVGAGRGASPFYAIVELHFDSSASMESALTSPAGQAVASGLSMFASGGATVLFCESGQEGLSVLPCEE